MNMQVMEKAGALIPQKEYQTLMEMFVKNAVALQIARDDNEILRQNIALAGVNNQALVLGIQEFSKKLATTHLELMDARAKMHDLEAALGLAGIQVVINDGSVVVIKINNPKLG